MNAFRPALVVIDVQNGFVNAGSAHVVPVVADLAARWADAAGALVLTRYRNYPGSPFERLIGWTRLQDEAEIELVPELAALADRAVVADKTGYTALTPQVAALAAEHGWTDLFLCGIDTANRFHPFLAGPRSVQRARRRMAGAILFLCANYWIYMCVLWYQQTIGVAWPAYVPLPKVISMINFAPDYGFCLFTACCACLIWASFQAEYQEQSEVAAPVFAVPEENEA